MTLLPANSTKTPELVHNSKFSPPGRRFPPSCPNILQPQKIDDVPGLEESSPGVVKITNDDLGKKFRLKRGATDSDFEHAQGKCGVHPDTGCGHQEALQPPGPSSVA